jgi:hypothetical protein
MGGAAHWRARMPRDALLSRQFARRDVGNDAS